MDNIHSVKINNSNRTVYVGLGSIISNLKTKKECRWFAQKSGKFF